MKLSNNFIIIISLLIFSVFAGDISERKLFGIKWKKSGTEDNIHTYIETNPQGKVVAVRGKTVIDTNPSAILKVLIDRNFETQKRWVPGLKEFKTLKSDSLSMKRILYVHVDLPWPVLDRDFVYSAEITTDTLTTQILLRYESVNGYIPEKKFVVRGEMKTVFIIRGKEINSTEVEIRALADPCGLVPKWAVNIAQKGYSYDMLKNIRVQTKPNNHKQRRIQ